MKKKVAIPALLFGAVAAGGLLYLTHANAFKAAAAATPPAPVPVVAGVVAQHDVPIYQNGVGTVIAYNTDVVRAQIQGQLISINFTEGQTVHAGDLLAQIDPRPYQAQIDQFEGNLERDQAQLTNARANFTRYSQLGDKGWATPQLIETQKAQVGQLEAAIKTDQALIEAAKVQLSYTRLTSPIDGVVGIRQIDVGNIISPTTTNGLVVVTQLDPISLIFTLPEGVLPQIQQQQQATKTPLPVLAYNQDDTLELGKGVLALVNNEILQTTGSIQLKATFPNKSRELWPGELVNARLLVTTRHNGLTVPASRRAARPERRLCLCHQTGRHGRDPPAQGRANHRRRSADRFRAEGRRAGRGRRTVPAAAGHACHASCTAKRPTKPRRSRHNRR